MKPSLRSKVHKEGTGGGEGKKVGGHNVQRGTSDWPVAHTHWSIRLVNPMSTLLEMLVIVA